MSGRFSLALILWTVFLWISRLRNVLGNDELTSSGRAVRLGVVVLFVALAGLAMIGLRRKQPKLLWLLIGWTIGYWLVRGVGILVDDYSTGFKVVHTVLMVVSIGLASLAWRERAAVRSSDRTLQPSR